MVRLQRLSLNTLDTLGTLGTVGTRQVQSQSPPLALEGLCDSIRCVFIVFVSPSALHQGTVASPKRGADSADYRWVNQSDTANVDGGKHSHKEEVHLKTQEQNPSTSLRKLQLFPGSQI